jgi:hypothetical protein
VQVSCDPRANLGELPTAHHHIGDPRQHLICVEPHDASMEEAPGAEDNSAISPTSSPCLARLEAGSLAVQAADGFTIDARRLFVVGPHA